jgi:heme oxygenase
MNTLIAVPEAGVPEIHVAEINAAETPALSARLRSETAASHRALEAVLDMLAPSFDFARYCETLRGFHAFLHPLLAMIAAQVPARYCRDVNLQRHLERLDRDIAALRLAPRRAAAGAELPRISGAAQAWGALYVIEGSTLGARILAPHFHAAFAIDADSGCAYFSGDAAAPHDESRGLSWPAFRRLLDSAVETSAHSSAVDAANATFFALQCWLVSAAV